MGVSGRAAVLAQFRPGFGYSQCREPVVGGILFVNLNEVKRQKMSVVTQPGWST